jgi:hypothetical protein
MTRAATALLALALILTQVWFPQRYFDYADHLHLAWVVLLRDLVLVALLAVLAGLAGAIGDRAALGSVVKINDWNQYVVIARGGTFLHIVNGQLMSVMVDDDPASSNNQPGMFGIEIEATTKVSVRNIWVRKIS